MYAIARSLLSRTIFDCFFSRSASIPNPHVAGLTLVSPLRRRLTAGGEAAGYDKEVDEINLKFAEAREEIEAAMESKDTVYFNEEAECAREAAKSALDLFDGLLARLPETERAAVQRAMGLKMEQLKAELKQLED